MWMKRRRECPARRCQVDQEVLGQEGSVRKLPNMVQVYKVCSYLEVP